MSSKRLFLVIPLPKDFSEFLITSIQYIRLSGRFVPVENLHITAHFFGNIKGEVIPELCKTIEEAVHTSPIIEIEFEGFKLKRQSHNSMIWAVFQKSDPLVDLLKGIRTKLELTETHFVAHVTLVRLKGKPSIELPSKLKKHTVLVNRLELWESVLGDTGPVYHSLHRFQLKSNETV